MSIPSSALKISFVIPVLNDAAGLRRCLASIRANAYPADALEVIVGDNGSRDGSAEAAREAGATVVRLPGLSVAAARNRMAALASGDILAFVDADHELASGWIASAVAALGRAGVAAVGAPYHPPSACTWVQRAYNAFRDHPAEPSETRWLGSGNLAIRAAAFRDVGGFDTTLTTCEDVDFCQRLRQRGFRLLADARLHSIHYGDPGTLRQLFKSELWRGRDNLQVSFRVPLTLRDLPSVVMPLMTLGCLAGLPLAALAAAQGAPSALVWLPLAAMLAAPAARAATMLRRLGAWGPAPCAQAYAVAMTYEMARALALVVRTGHRRASS